jgi:hypothetical protein
MSAPQPRARGPLARDTPLTKAISHSMNRQSVEGMASSGCPPRHSGVFSGQLTPSVTRRPWGVCSAKRPPRQQVTGQTGNPMLPPTHTQTLAPAKQLAAWHPEATNTVHIQLHSHTKTHTPLTGRPTHKAPHTTDCSPCIDSRQELCGPHHLGRSARLVLCV